MSFVKSFSATCIILSAVAVHAAEWSAPQLPSADLSKLSASTNVYLYNVETDAFLINGMNWNTNACATRLINGDKAASSAQRCQAVVTGSQVKIRLTSYSSYFLSCLSAAENNIYVDQNQGQTFTFKADGQGAYTLTNTTYSKPLDVTWSGGGHLTLTGGAGHTLWAFIPETSVTNGSYTLYKARKQLYNLYCALDTARCSRGALDTAYIAYTSPEATAATLQQAAKDLFAATYPFVKQAVDVSFLFKNCNMSGLKTVAGWSSSSATYGWGEYEKYHSAYTLSQTQEVPNGLYRAVLRSLYRNDASDAAPVLTATATNTVKASVPLMNDIDFKVTNGNSNGWVSGGQGYIPDNMQSCAQALAHTDAVATAGNIIVQGGRLTLSLCMTSANQWLNWQEMSVIYEGAGDQSLREELSSLIDTAVEHYGDGSRPGSADLLQAIEQARNVYDNPDATLNELLSAKESLQKAIDVFLYVSASVEHPLDWTGRLSNPSFEDGFTDWTAEGLQIQTNTSFTIKAGAAYAEKWVSKGSKVGDASVFQQVRGLEMGTYILKAAAQNIQESAASKAQTGASLIASDTSVAVTVRKDYQLIFTHLGEQSFSIGFKAVGATGNWLAIDNFRLYYAGKDSAAFDSELGRRISHAVLLIPQKMQALVLDSLQSVVSQAGDVLLQHEYAAYGSIATRLYNWTEKAQQSIDAYAALAETIAAAKTVYGDGEGKEAGKLLDAITLALSVYDDSGSSVQTLNSACTDLNNAVFSYRLANATGTVPTVVTDTRYARGATMAFGRSTVSGVSTSQLLETGFCWSSESEEPNVMDDNRSSSYITKNGKIYRMEGLQPATCYYVRAYALTKNYAVGYGDVLKIYTLPKGNITWWYNNGGPADANERINKALDVAVNTWWNQLTSIKGLNISCTYGSGTPTADCSYGGSMRIGPSSSYQAVGTVQHEMNHAIGGGTTPTWYGPSVLRAGSTTGYWLGERANAVLRFWENDNTAQITGDATHFWPYGINGAQEDDGTESLYICNALINQAFCEDGMIPVNYWSGGFCLPAYVFEHEEGVKYYLTNESQGCGKSYLREKENRYIGWVEMTGNEALENDSAAWYMTFDPAKGYYYLQNVATGKYVTYAGGTSNAFRTVARNTPTASEQFHVMKGRTDVTVGNFKDRGYWLIHPASSNTPPCLTAANNHIVSGTSFDIANTATQQRWLILDEAGVKSLSGNIPEALPSVKASDTESQLYNLQGIPVESEHGITIFHGEKHLLR